MTSANNSPDNNLYVGTSASELLHFVKIPPDPASPSESPVYILASRLNPAYVEPSIAPTGPPPGVQQILLLPRVGKACILCNWTATFYSLPELSPDETSPVKNCSWIGGNDLNESISDEAGATKANEAIILLSLNRAIQVVRIEPDHKARGVKVGCVMIAYTLNRESDSAFRKSTLLAVSCLSAATL